MTTGERRHGPETQDPQLQQVLLVSDIDGTLTEGDGPLPKPLVSLIEEFRHRGGRFTLATGRPPILARRYVDQLRVREPVICLNGAVVCEPSSGTVRELRSFPEIVARAVTCSLQEAGFTFIAHRSGESLDSVQKITVLAPCAPEHCCSIPGLAWVQSGEGCYDLMPLGVSKGATLRRVAGQMGVSLGRIVTIGDNLNDVEMTEIAGAGVAVANAHEGLKAIASHITANRSWQGVAEVIETLLDGRLTTRAGLPLQPPLRHRAIGSIAVAAL
jgi:hydroxymethylpyrimidine pyrophosphatase-like HAD family hydrolase